MNPLIKVFVVAMTCVACGTRSETTEYEKPEGRDSLSITTDEQYAAIKEGTEDSSEDSLVQFEGAAKELIDYLLESKSGWVYRLGAGEYNERFTFSISESSGGFENQDGRIIQSIDTTNSKIAFGWPGDSVDILCTSFEPINDDFVRVGEWNQCQFVLAQNLYAKKSYVEKLGTKFQLKGEWQSVSLEGSDLVITILSDGEVVKFMGAEKEAINQNQNPYFQSSGTDGVEQTFALREEIVDEEMWFTGIWQEATDPETKIPYQTGRLIEVQRLK